MTKKTKSSIKEYNKNYRIKNREKLKIRDKAYALEHKEELEAYQKGYRSKNKDKTKAYQKEYRLKNEEQAAIYRKEYYKDNQEKLKAQKRDYYIKNKEKKLAWDKAYYASHKEERNAYMREKYKTDYKHRLRRSISIAMNKSLKGNKKGYHWEDLVGYTLDELKKHLKKHFKEGMTWENYGEWHIDHIIPIAVHNFIKPEDEDFKRCWALSNLQPLWAKENNIKQAKIEKHFQPSLVF